MDGEDYNAITDATPGKAGRASIWVTDGRRTASLGARADTLLTSRRLVSSTLDVYNT